MLCIYIFFFIRHTHVNKCLDYVRMYVCMYLCMYVCMYVYIYVCMYVCMYVYIYIYNMHIYTQKEVRNGLLRGRLKLDLK